MDECQHDRTILTYYGEPGVISVICINCNAHWADDEPIPDWAFDVVHDHRMLCILLDDV